MRREDSTVQFCTGFSFGLLLGTFLVVLLSAWLHGRAVERRAWTPTPIRATPIVHLQDRPAIRAAEIERRKERFDPVEINLGAIIQIESSGNPLAVSPAGCRGLCQIAKGTWCECTILMGVDWTWEEDAFDPGCNRAVGQFYINHRIPQMLRAYEIPDSEATRIGAYNAGIGRVRHLWREHGTDWLSHAPRETQYYVVKYAAIMSRQAK